MSVLRLCEDDALAIHTEGSIAKRKMVGNKPHMKPITKPVNFMSMEIASSIYMVNGKSPNVVEATSDTDRCAIAVVDNDFELYPLPVILIVIGIFRVPFLKVIRMGFSPTSIIFSLFFFVVSNRHKRILLQNG